MRHLARLIFALGALGLGGLFAVPSASAHAELAGSNPAEGDQLAVAPVEIRLDFTKPINPERLTVTLDNRAQLIDLGAPFLDPNGGDVVIIPIIEAVPNGQIGFSWRSVGDDGHVIDGRVDFVVSAPLPATTVAATTVAAASPTVTIIGTATSPPPAGGAIDLATSVATVAPNSSPTTDPALIVTQPVAAPQVTVAAVAPSGSDLSALDQNAETSADSAVLSPLEESLIPDSGRVPSFLLGLTRWIGYLAFSAWMGGYLLVGWMWKNAARSALLRRWLRTSWIALVASAGLGVLFQSWLIKGSPGLLLGDMWSFTAGRGLLGKLILVIALGTFALDTSVITGAAGRMSAGFVTVMTALSITASGHAATERWLWAGVFVQTIHVLAIAAWLGLLAALGMILLREANDNDSRFAAAQFSSIAPILLAAIVATGVFQTVRFVGGPGNLFSSTHGRWLLLKLVVIGAMLLFARVSRDRIGRRLIGRADMTRRTREQLRRAMVAEFMLGIVTLAVTAMLVVQQPAG